jgi:hypothetical protein
MLCAKNIELIGSSISQNATKSNSHMIPIITDECLPYNIRSHYLEYEMENTGHSTDIAVGLVSTGLKGKYSRINYEVCTDEIKHVFMYECKDGAIWYEEAGLEKNKLCSGKPIKSGDVLGFHVIRVGPDSLVYNICQAFKNGNKIGPPHTIEGSNLWPCVLINSPGAKINANFGNREFKYNKGMCID